MNVATGRIAIATGCVLVLFLACSCSEPQKAMELDEAAVIRAVDALDLDVLNKLASAPPDNFMADGVKRFSIKTSVGQKDLMCDLHDPSIPGPSDTTYYMAIATKILASESPGKYAQLAYACLLYLYLAEEPLAKEVMEQYRTTEVEEIRVRLQKAFFMKQRDSDQEVVHGIGTTAPQKVSSVPLEPKPRIYECGSYTFFLHEFPRADGSAIQAGSLYLDGKPVAGGDYHRLELPMGSFIWYPPTENAKQIGWTRIDPEKKHSRWDMAIISDRKDSRGNWVTKEKPSPEEERNRRREVGQPENPEEFQRIMNKPTTNRAPVVQPGTRPVDKGED